MDLTKLSEKLYEELAKYGERELSLSSLDTIDKLAHAIKNIEKIEEAGGSSSRGSYRRSYDGEMSSRYRRSYDSYDGDTSSRRGRDSMGRYTRDGYSRHGIVDRLEELSEQTNDDRVKSELRKMISQMENN